MFIKLTNKDGGVHHVNLDHVVYVFQGNGVVEVLLVPGSMLTFLEGETGELIEKMSYWTDFSHAEPIPPQYHSIK